MRAWWWWTWIHLAAFAVASEIHAQGGLTWAYALDVADLAAIEVLRRRLPHEIGRISMLIDNARIVHAGEVEKVPLDAHLRTCQVNTLRLYDRLTTWLGVNASMLH